MQQDSHPGLLSTNTVLQHKAALKKNGHKKVRVIGVGDGGSHAINRMMKVKVRKVELIAVNTDAQVLEMIEAHKKLQIGRKLTQGLGAGGNPDIGRKAAEESEAEIADLLAGLDMVFITAGMGGGTGTGAAPVIARMAKEMGILTTAVVTRPFYFEGRARGEKAHRGIEELRRYTDVVIAISNDRLLKLAPADLSLTRVFELADDILRQGVQGISDLILTPDMINLDFAEVDAMLRNAGRAVMGIGVGEGKELTKDVVRKAISSPLLEGSIERAQRIILNITGGESLSLNEVTEAATLIRDAVPDQADIFFGTVIEDGYEKVKLTVIATGFDKFVNDEGGGGKEEKDDLDVLTFLRRKRPSSERD